MSYLVLARKWRPQTFEELMGQGHVTRTLQNAISSGRLAHAFLFTGPRGVGKTSAARILAKAVNCVDGPTPKPCNQCENCVEITNSNAIDVLEIDGASNTGVDNVRELRESVKYLPSKARYRIYIIDEVHMLSTSAFNALLKTLEEPPPHVLFIFATTEPHKIPMTILSRCQGFDFKRIPLAMIFERLREITDSEGIGISEDCLRLIAREAEGSMRDAQSLLDQVVSYSDGEVHEEDVLQLLGVADRSALFDFADAIIEGDTKRCLHLLDGVYTSGYDLERFCKDLLDHFRNLLVVKIEGQTSATLNVPEDAVEAFSKQAGNVGFADLHRWFQILLKALASMNRSPVPKIILEMTLVEMAHLESLLPVDEILARVERLEGGFFQRKGESHGERGTPVMSQLERERDVDYGREASRVSPAAQEKQALTDDALRQWEDFLVFLRGENPILASFLDQRHPLRLDDSLVEIGFVKGSFALDRINEPDNLDALKKAL